MTEHEKLKEICDTIGYTHDTWDFYNNIFLKYEPHYTQWKDVECEIIIDVREIIFTPEFMDKYTQHKAPLHMCPLLENLDNPVDFLYKNILW